MQKVFEHPLAELGVLHLWVPLHAVELALVAGEGGDRSGCAGGQHLETGGSFRHGVAVAHPGGLLRRGAGEQGSSIAGERDRRRAVFAQAGLRDLTAELHRHQLEAVANAEHWNAEFQDAVVERRRTRLVDARRPTAEHDADRVQLGDLRRGDRVRHDLGVYARLANPAGDQLGVLRAKIDDEYRTLIRFAHALTSTCSLSLASSVSIDRGTLSSRKKESSGMTPPSATNRKRRNDQRINLQSTKSQPRYST